MSVPSKANVRKLKTRGVFSGGLGSLARGKLKRLLSKSSIKFRFPIFFFRYH